MTKLLQSIRIRCRLFTSAPSSSPPPPPPFLLLFCFWGQHTTKVDVSHLKHFPIDTTSNNSTINTLIRLNKEWFPLFTFVPIHHCFWKQSINFTNKTWTIWRYPVCVRWNKNTFWSKIWQTRWAIMTVLNLVTEYLSLYGCQLTIHGGRERSINGPSTEFKGTVWEWKMHACKLMDGQYEWLYFFIIIFF